MQTVAVAMPSMKPSVYGAGGYAFPEMARWGKTAVLPDKRNRLAFASVTTDDDLNNGDPPDVMLWGEE
ncbi:MAG: hypothetical protein ACNA71_00770 [Kiritimatiellia bacterium]